MYPMRTRGEVDQKLELFLADVGSPGTLVSDGAHEYKSRGVNEVCRETGIRRSTQRFTLNRKMAKSSGRGALSQEWPGECSRRRVCLSKKVWPYALATPFYVKKDVPTLRTTVRRMKCSLARPHLCEMQPFGCRAFVLTEDRKKLDSKANLKSIWATGTGANVSQEPLHLSTQTSLTIDALRGNSVMSLVYTT